MTDTIAESSWIRLWLLETAAPLWLGIGAHTGGGVWESLDLAGRLATGQSRPVRAQFRQALVCADLTARFPDHPQAARWCAFAVAPNEWALTHGVNRDTGNLGALMAPDGRLHDLYGLAFVLLAGGAPIRAGAAWHGAARRSTGCARRMDGTRTPPPRHPGGRTTIYTFSRPRARWPGSPASPSGMAWPTNA